MAETKVSPTSWFEAHTCDLDEFRAIVEQSGDVADYPHALRIEHGAVVYDTAAVREAVARDRRPLLAEFAAALADGPGIIVFLDAFDHTVIERANGVFAAIITEERERGLAGGDHFAKPGANDRIWNALQKLAHRDPELFAEYYRSDVLALAAEAWLGPGYQVTSQVNVVNPGGDAQLPHRDYHLGFMENDVAEQYPAHVHRLSPVMTLQGAVAHCEMPIETGPTMYLPYSQRYEAGYVAWRLPEFRDYFAEHHVQIPLGTGDCVFFNPALFHGAGRNTTTDVHRMANLLQIGSAMGRTLEAVDRRAMVRTLYPVLAARLANGEERGAIDRVVAASAEGYPFPCDLDVDQPVDGLTPPSDAELVRRALDDGWTPEQLAERLR